MTFPLDPTGVAGSNLVSNETHTTYDVYVNTFNHIFLDKGPFYSSGLVVTYTPTGGSPLILALDADYALAYQFPNIEADSSNLTFGAIVVLDRNLKGNFTITYQALGGDWVYDKMQIYNYQANNELNPKVAFPALVYSPDVYPATTSINLTTFANIAISLIGNSPIRLGMIYAPLGLIAIPAVPPGSVQLPPNAAEESGGNLANIRTTNTAISIATQAEALATGTKSDVAWSGSGDGSVIAVLKSIAVGISGLSGGGGGSSTPTIEPTLRYEQVSDTLAYLGKAVPGSSESSSVWQIKQIISDTNGNINVLLANGTSAYTNSWTNRATYTY